MQIDMKPGELTKLIARAYRVEEKTVSVYARWLREAGLLTTGARGVNAPDMTPLDAARLTIALLATDRPAGAVERARRFGAMQIYRVDPYTSGEDLGDLLGDREITLEQSLAEIIKPRPDWFRSTRLPYVEINENGRFARVEFQGGKAMFRMPDRDEDEAAVDRAALHGIRQIRGLASAELSQVATPFLLEARDAGLAPWALPEGGR